MKFNKIFLLTFFIMTSSAFAVEATVSLGLEHMPDPDNYNIKVRGFPANQDVFLVKGMPYFQLFLKTKNWVKSVLLMVEVNGIKYPLKATQKVKHQPDNSLFINNKLDSFSDYLASSATINMKATGDIFCISIPQTIWYGNNKNKNTNLISFFDKIIIRLYSETFGRGSYIDVDYFLKEKLGIKADSGIKVLGHKEKAPYMLYNLEYRGQSLNIKGIALEEKSKSTFTILPPDLLLTMKQKIVTAVDAIQLVHWRTDNNTLQTVINFLVLLRKTPSKRQVSVVIRDDLPQQHSVAVDVPALSQ